MNLFESKKKLKQRTRKTTINNKNKFAFSKLFDLKENNVLLSTYRHEILQNIFSWKAEENILLSTY